MKDSGMKDSGKYRVTHHLGRRPDSEDAEVIFSYPDEEPARRFYQRHLPPRVGYVLALWRPDGVARQSKPCPLRQSSLTDAGELHPSEAASGNYDVWQANCCKA
jgi:hypothetical protein